MSKAVPSWDNYELNLSKPQDKGHRCEGTLPESVYGAAIAYCYEDVDGKLWVTNEEYASQVNFCPYCGYKVKVEAGMK